MRTTTFNTHRTYTEHGQRIAAAEIDGGCYFVDIDRGIHGFLAGCPLEHRAILQAYDTSKYAYTPPSMDGNEPGLEYKASCARWDAFRALRTKLELLAKGTTA